MFVELGRLATIKKTENHKKRFENITKHVFGSAEKSITQGVSFVTYKQKLS